MVQPAFNIGSGAQPADDCRLMVEISGQSFNYIMYNDDPWQLLLLRQYRLYTTAQQTIKDAIEEIISGDEHLQTFSRQATVLYNFPESNLVPQELHDSASNEAMMRLIYGEANTGIVLEEKVENWRMHNVYTVADDIHFLLKEKFRDSGYWHFYTLLLRSSSENISQEGSFLKIIFYGDKFITSVFSAGKLLLIQTFAYQTPEDAAYYLLLACRQSDIKPSDAVLLISGLIDTQSALYSELMKYFPDVRYEGFREDMDVNKLLSDYPAHYFSPLLNMCLCV
jgi:Protein of unknown function (DUF3822)